VHNGVTSRNGLVTEPFDLCGNKGNSGILTVAAILVKRTLNNIIIPF
jgi:hypothetical protein